ncbi:MAG: hypothetical protein GX248_09365 [Peptococcaceae bacterium]|nr:hypothetical protein [Peptococcaceae bacterium]
MAVLNSIQFELRDVETQMSKEFGLKASGMKDLIQLQMDNLDQFLLPAICLAVARTAGPVNNTVIALSSVLQHLYLAQHIHSMVRDQEMTDSERQYPILVGDYVFGQSFLKMCEEDLFKYVSHFVTAIKKINEGIVLRWRLKNQKMSVKDYKAVIEKEKASLTVLAARLGAEGSNLKSHHFAKFEKLGYNIGMAWAASIEPQYSFLTQEYLSKTMANINDLQETFSVQPLQELYNFIRQESGTDVYLSSNIL